MSTQTITLRKVDVLSDDDINSPKDWLIARQRLLSRAQELRQLRDQLIVKGCALNCAKADEELVFDAPAGTVMQAELLNRRDPSFRFAGGSNETLPPALRKMLRGTPFLGGQLSNERHSRAPAS